MIKILGFLSIVLGLVGAVCSQLYLVYITLSQILLIIQGEEQFTFGTFMGVVFLFFVREILALIVFAFFAILGTFLINID